MNRRDFLKLSASASILPLMSLSDQLQAAQTGGDYKAIVVVLLEGGADVFNMIAPIDNAHQDYAQARAGIALNKDSLLPISPEYGMRENMQAMQQQYLQKKLAIIANVGTLIKPVTQSDVLNGSPVPFELFAHNTQRLQWMLGDATGNSSKGWAARIADIFSATPNPFFNISTADVNDQLQYGGKANSLHFDDASISPDTMKYYGFGPKSGGGELGEIYQGLYEKKLSNANKLMQAFARKRVEELNMPLQLLDLFEGVKDFDYFNNGVHEIGKPLGKQLKLIAQILSVKDNFPNLPKRQIYFAIHHGWDTHDSDNEHLVAYLSDSFGAFQNALHEIGIEEQVTTITISDFGRSLTANNAGTDHGWGSHAFVMGGSVKGGEIYGTMPQLSKNSPDFWSDTMIPSTSMEQYLSSIIDWFGATQSELDHIFPNRQHFNSQNMEFMVV